MDDLISRQAVIDGLQAEIDNAMQNPLIRCGIRLARNYINDLPSADAVEVVRCKDCKFNPNDTWFDCPMAHLPYKEDRWCWKGERKDD